MAYSLKNTKYKHLWFKNILDKIMLMKKSNKTFIYVDLNSGAGLGYLNGRYIRDESVINSSFEVISTLIKEKRNGVCYLIDSNPNIIRQLCRNLHSYYSKYTVTHEGNNITLMGENFTIEVYPILSKNIDAVPSILPRINKDDLGLVYADPKGGVNNSEKCFKYFDEFNGMDLLLHYSEVGKDRLYHNPKYPKYYRKGRTMNELEEESKRKNKYTTGIVSNHSKKYAFFFATNDKYRKKVREVLND